MGAGLVVAEGFNVRQTPVNAVNLVDNLATANILVAEVFVTLNRINCRLELTRGHELHDAELEFGVVFAASFLRLIQQALQICLLEM